MSDQKNRPLETLRDGSLKASIWENQREDHAAHNVQFRKGYRDQDGQYRDTDNFSSGDLLRLLRLAEQSYDRIKAIREAAREGRTESRPRTRERDRGRER